jgi:hypothetical protein
MLYLNYSRTFYSLATNKWLNLQYNCCNLTLIKKEELYAKDLVIKDYNKVSQSRNKCLKHCITSIILLVNIIKELVKLLK